jgi:hypothetical protein
LVINNSYATAVNRSNMLSLPIRAASKCLQRPAGGSLVS